jgi:hypothetical protein
MMPPELSNILTQIPIVAAFIWFVLEYSKRNQEALDKRDEQMQQFLQEQRKADREVLSQLVGELHDFRREFDEHDQATNEAIITMKERVKLATVRQKRNEP